MHPEPLYPRYDTTFTLQIESTDYPNLTGQSACLSACLDVNERRGNQPNNRTATWKMTETTDPDIPTDFNCNPDLCVAGCEPIAALYAARCAAIPDLKKKIACGLAVAAVFTGCKLGCKHWCKNTSSPNSGLPPEDEY
jgi:hypothetical protein